MKTCSKSEAAKAIGVHRNTIRNWCLAGRIQENAAGRIPERELARMAAIEHPEKWRRERNTLRLTDVASEPVTIAVHRGQLHIVPVDTDRIVFDRDLAQAIATVLSHYSTHGRLPALNHG